MHLTFHKFPSIFVILLFSLIHISVTGQSITTYKTYADYKSGKGVNQGELIGYKLSSYSKMTLKIVKGNQKIGIKLADIWGFSFEGYLFRVYRDMVPAAVVDKGAMVYYESGIVRLDILLKINVNKDLTHGPFSFFSFGINGEVVSSEWNKYFKKFRNHPRNQFPDKKQVLDCMDSDRHNRNHIRMCVRNYNLKQEENE